MRYVDGYVLPVPRKHLDATAASPGKPARSGGSTARSSTANASATT